jgi:MYXO-CTERM domain-containing protein
VAASLLAADLDAFAPGAADGLSPWLDPELRHLVRAVLTDALTGAVQSQERQVSAQVVPAKVGAIDAPELIARCGEPVQAQLTVTPAAQACPTETYQWSQTGGPPLLTPTQSGTTFQLTTQSIQLADLIGQTVQLQITADAGNGSTDVAQQSATIGVEPFVAVRHASDLPPASVSDQPFTVSVSFENPTASPLPTTTLAEALGDAQYVEGTARLDGALVPVQIEGGELKLSGVSLDAMQTRTLTFDVRPKVLGAVALQGKAQVNGVLVSKNGSFPPSPPTAVGCGCQATPRGYAAAWGLLLLVVFARRRHAT